MHWMEMISEHASHSVHVKRVTVEFFLDQSNEQVEENLAPILTEVAAHKMQIPKHPQTTDPVTFQG